MQEQQNMWADAWLLFSQMHLLFFFSPKQQSGESSVHLKIKRGERETQREDPGVVFFSCCNDSMWKSCPDTLIHIICAWSSNEIHVLYLILVLQMWKLE